MNQRKRHISLSNFPPKKDKDGNKICLNCGKIITKPRQRKYCGLDCANDFFSKHDHVALRSKLLYENDYTCQKCGKKVDWDKLYDSSSFILDHIIPIALGGEEFDRDNLQILCYDCNKKKTSEDMKKIAKQRRREKELKYDIEMVRISYPQQKELNI